MRRLFQWISFYVDYNFDDTDWEAVAATIPETDHEVEGGWYEYPLMGTPPLMVSAAQSVGADPVMVRIRGEMDAVLHARLDTLVSVLEDPSTAE